MRFVSPDSKATYRHQSHQLDATGKHKNINYTCYR